MKRSRNPPHTRAHSADGRSSSRRSAGEAEVLLQSLRSPTVVLVLALAAVILCFTILSHLTWAKWGDPVIDVGSELQVASRLAQGELLYRDVSYNYGPLPPYLNSLLIRIFGARIESILVGSFLSITLMALVIAGIVRVFLPAWAAIILILSFLLESVFSHYYINGSLAFVLPYTFSAVHSILFASASLLFLLRYLRNGTTSWILISSVLAGLAILCKLEIAAAAVITLLLFSLIAKGKHPDDFPSLRRILAATLLPLLLIALIGYLPLILATSPRCVLTENILRSSLLDFRGNIFTINVLGAGEAADNARQVLFSLALWLALPVAIWLGTKALTWKAGSRGSTLFASCVALISLVPVILLAVGGARLFDPFRILKGIPALFLLLFIFLAVRWLRSTSRRNTQEFCLLALCGFSILTLARIILNVGMFHYGFYMALPALIALSVVITYVCLLVFSQARRHPQYVAALAVAFVVAMSVKGFLGYSWPAWKLGTVEIQGNGGTLRTIPTPLNQYLGAGFEYLEQVIGENESLIVIPEGVMLNFLLRRENPTRYHIFTPPELAGREADVVREINEHNVDCVLLVDRDVTEFGQAGPGIDYALSLMEFLGAEYDSVAGLGATPFSGPPGGWLLLRRRSLP